MQDGPDVGAGLRDGATGGAASSARAGGGAQGADVARRHGATAVAVAGVGQAGKGRRCGVSMRIIGTSWPHPAASSRKARSLGGPVRPSVRVAPQVWRARVASASARPRYSPCRRLRARPANSRSYSGSGSARIALATTAIGHGITRYERPDSIVRSACSAKASASIRKGMP